MGSPQPLFCLFLVFFEQKLQFLQQINVKNLSIQLKVVGLEPTTFRL